VDCTDLVVAYHRAAHERALVREAARVAAEASGAARRAPLSGHHRAIERAQREFGSAPPSFCGIAVPPGCDVVDFAHKTVRGAGATAKAIAQAVFDDANAELKAGASPTLAASAGDSPADGAPPPPTRRQAKAEAKAQAKAARKDAKRARRAERDAESASPSPQAAAPAPAASGSGVVSEADLAVLEAAAGEWTGSPEQVAVWEADWEGRVWVPTRPVRNRHDPDSARGVVPCYLEGPIRARPRDFLWLSPDEAIEEHRHTLALYEAITARIEDAERVAEAKVLAHRHAKGLGPFDSDRS